VVGRDLVRRRARIPVADLIVLPILAIYRKYYGTAFAIRITALMFTTMVLAALIVAAAFSALHLTPSGPRPTRADVFSSVHVDYKLALNILGLAIFAALFGLTARRGATDPVCGMHVDKAKAVKRDFAGTTYYFCGNHCAHIYASAHQHGDGHADHAHAHH
jgi:YHS domain-containing protein